VIAGAGAGGGGAGGGVGTASATGHRLGGTAGAELSATIGRHDALVFACDAWLIRAQGMTPASEVVYPRATWTHAWQHLHLTGGVYGLWQPLAAKTDGVNRYPIGPFANVAYNWD